MTNKQIDLVKSSWAIVATIDPVTVGGCFYAAWLEISPDVKPMFVSIAEQSKKIMAMLGYIINKLDKLDEIIDEVRKLALRHVQYGVTVEHYTAGGVALLWDFEKGLSENWNSGTKRSMDSLL
jgi:nitric oxide dioxygenase